jgi:outer membrane immunogenic protein
MRNRIFATASALALTSNAVFAADLPTKKGPPPAPQPAPYSWTGFYGGLEGGYGWGQENDNFSAATGYPLDHIGISGAIGGVDVGYDQQFGTFVVGVGANLEASGLSGKKSYGFFDEGNGISSLSVRNTWQAALLGRAGVAFDRLLVYGAAGVAFADDREKSTIIDPGYPLAAYGDQTKTLVGWTIGLGADYAVDAHWILTSELRYASFGRGNYSITDTLGAGTVNYKAGFDETLLQVGIRYKF